MSGILYNLVEQIGLYTGLLKIHTSKSKREVNVPGLTVRASVFFQGLIGAFCEGNVTDRDVRCCYEDEVLDCTRESRENDGSRITSNFVRKKMRKRNGSC